MAILLRNDAPKDGHDTIAKAISDISDTPPSDELVGGGSLNLSEPMPVYLLGLSDIRTDPDPLAKAKLVAWRYILERPDADLVAYADVKEREAKTEFVSVSSSDIAMSLLEAAHIAQKVAQKLQGDVEIRVIEIPAVKLSAVWLADGSDVFIPYIDGVQNLKLKLKTIKRDRLLAELTDRAKYVDQ
ncbi:hypothetical protein HFO33_32605 [Rhizobium leguminosarum]|uniref:hypothetical protein n=1 Tax=Rhizobium leguminosarum TaxID=384 RepID=UPI001C979CF3|nr:hypothetical protein [Rhizobium leguminosarum]MBY5721244.1 hypothetical protein [Rhizobium leguminosarum]